MPLFLIMDCRKILTFPDNPYFTESATRRLELSLSVYLPVQIHSSQQKRWSPISLSQIFIKSTPSECLSLSCWRCHIYLLALAIISKREREQLTILLQYIIAQSRFTHLLTQITTCVISLSSSANCSSGRRVQRVLQFKHRRLERQLPV